MTYSAGTGGVDGRNQRYHNEAGRNFRTLGDCTQCDEGEMPEKGGKP
jgi:hypothetical protein